MRRRPESVRLPDFIVIGPPRTGTTWLHRVLEGHVGLPAGIKETQFFSWNHGQGLQWYHSFFRDIPLALPAGEIAPACFDHPEARERIAALIPHCRIVCTLRDPVARLYSQYKAWHRVGRLCAAASSARRVGRLCVQLAAVEADLWRRQRDGAFFR